MYTITAQPLEAINTIDCHGGLALILIMVVGITVILASTLIEEDDYASFMKKVIGFDIIIIAIAATVSFNTGYIHHYENVKVKGKMIEQFPQSVVYEVEGSRIVLEMKPGLMYPKNAIFYKNLKKD